MSLNHVIETVKASNQIKKEIRSHLLPVSKAQSVFLDDFDTTVSLLSIADALSNCEDDGLSDKAVDMRDELVALLKAYNDEVEECVKENKAYNQKIHNKELEEVRNLNSIVSTIPEYALTQKVKINTTKINPAQIDIMREIYLSLGITHVLLEEDRDTIYYNPEITPYLRDLIAERFLVHFPKFINPKGLMNISPVYFLDEVEDIQRAAVK